jgi:capsular exopolysaccharide synthesis family protein
MTGTGAARLIRVYGVWIALVTGVVIAAAIGVGLSGAHVYESDAIVVVEARVRANTTPVAPDMGTEKEIAKSGLVLDPAARELDVSPGELFGELVVGVAPDANVLTFSVMNANPAVAQNHAQAIAMAYVYYRNSGEGAASAATSTQHATLVTAAPLPGTPVERSVWVSVGIGLALGLLLGIGTALIRDRGSDRVRGREDFERVSGTTVLATVPRQAGRRKGGRRQGTDARPVLLSAPGSPTAESFRYLRSRLQPLLRGPATILVTSAGDGEGRTTTAANLAIAIAQAGARVVLVDADLRNPGLHTAFGLDDVVGLADVLTGEVSPARALRDTSVPGLRLMTAGPGAAGAGDLLAGDRLRRALDMLRAHCDVVVLDSAPVLSVADTITLAGMSDHILLVGDQRRTTRGYVTRALDELREVLRGNLSAVLLNVPRGAGGPKPRGKAVTAGTNAVVSGPPLSGPPLTGPAAPPSGSAAVPSALPPTSAPPSAPSVPTIYSSASASKSAARSGKSGPRSGHPGAAGDSGEGRDQPGQPGDGAHVSHGDIRRRLTRRG